jgi:hypothetical protein
MKGLIKLGLASVLVMATALPAMAKTWDVCIDPTTDLNASTELVKIPPTALAANTPMFFSAVASVFPVGTFTSSTLTSCSPPIGVTAVGTFFAKGAAVGNLPADASADVFFVDWYFRFKTGGAFSTTGPVRAVGPGSVYRQAITGSFGGKAAATGKAFIVVVSSAGTDGATVDAFSITVP